jgi:uncharacterized metal-binding protein
MRPGKERKKVMLVYSCGGCSEPGKASPISSNQERLESSVFLGCEENDSG